MRTRLAVFICSSRTVLLISSTPREDLEIEAIEVFQFFSQTPKLRSSTPLQKDFFGGGTGGKCYQVHDEQFRGVGCSKKIIGEKKKTKFRRFGGERKKKQQEAKSAITPTVARLTHCRLRCLVWLTVRAMIAANGRPYQTEDTVGWVTFWDGGVG